MIKPSELMINDWVNIDDHPYQIAAVHNSKIGYHIYPNKLHWARAPKLGAIAISTDYFSCFRKRFASNLTSCIYLYPGFNKFGLVANNDGSVDIIRLFYNSNGTIATTQTHATIRYIHELQHFFTFYSIKLDISIT